MSSICRHSFSLPKTPFFSDSLLETIFFALPVYLPSLCIFLFFPAACFSLCSLRTVLSVPSPLAPTTETCRTQCDPHLGIQLMCCCSDCHPAECCSRQGLELVPSERYQQAEAWPHREAPCLEFLYALPPFVCLAFACHMPLLCLF